jgi:choice-of-anchor C domain-containing protein
MRFKVRPGRGDAGSHRCVHRVVRQAVEAMESRQLLAATLVNGSFETPALASGFSILSAGNTTLTGWTIGGTNIAHVHDSTWKAKAGNRSIDLRDGLAASITQTVTGLTTGTTYRVSFWMSRNMYLTFAQAKVKVSAGTTNQIITFSGTGLTTADPKWQLKTFDFTPTATSVPLRFEAANPGAGYPALDDIKIAPLGPEIEVKGNNADIVDGDATPAITDHTDFGSTPVGTPVTRTFTVRNTGGAALTTSGLTVPAGFAIDASDTLAASIPAGGQDTFKVRLSATGAGNFQGTLTFANNDSNENPFNFTIKGSVTAPAPETLVQGNAVEIVDGDATPVAADHTDFGAVNVGAPLTRTFTVRNTGSAALTTSGLTVPAGFSIDPADTLVASIAPGGQDTFKVKLNATAAGTFAGTVSFANNDANENPYNFAIKGVVNQPTFSLVNNVLTVTGTANADFIRGQIVNNVLTMRMNTTTQTFSNASSITKIVINALGGNDLVLLSQSVNRPTSIFGGDGNDTLTGGGAADTITGGAGTDTATKNSGDVLSDVIEEVLA